MDASELGRPARAPWNRRQDGLLRGSVAEALRLAITRAPHLRALADLVVPNLPWRPLASWSLKTDSASSAETALPYALTAPWFSPNTAEWVNVIIIDADHDDLDVLEELVWIGCPAPTWVSVSPESGRFHAVWWLARPADMRPGAPAGPKRLLRYAIALLNGALRGDQNCVNRLTKNPWGILGNAYVSMRFAMAPFDAPTLWLAHDASGTWLRWHTIPGSAEGVQLAAIVGAMAEEYRQHARWPNRDRRHAAAPDGKTKTTGSSRNCDVFAALGNWSRAHDERDGAAILGKAIAINAALPLPLGRREVQTVARSVTKWMATKWRGRGGSKRRSVMRLGETHVSLPEKQAMGGRFSARQNASKHTAAVLDAACRLFSELGKRPSASEIVAASKASVATVKRRSKAIRAALDKIDAAAAPPHPPTLPTSITDIHDNGAAVVSRQSAPPPTCTGRRDQGLAFAESLAADEADPARRRQIIDDYMRARRRNEERHRRRIANPFSKTFL